MASGKNHRLNRINDEIFRETADIIRGELKDPRVSIITSVVAVDTSVDLKHCKIFVSVLGDGEQKKDVMKGLKNAKGFVRKLLAQRINLRNTPEINFVLDESLEEGIRINQLIDEAMKSIPSHNTPEEMA